MMRQESPRRAQSYAMTQMCHILISNGAHSNPTSSRQIRTRILSDILRPTYWDRLHQDQSINPPPTLVTTIARATTQLPHLTARSLGSCRVVERWSQEAALAHLPRPRPPNVTLVLIPSIADGHARPLKNNEPKGWDRGRQYKRIGENMEDPTRVAITRRAFSGRRIVDGSARGRLRSSEV
jgi:hypothetical protein